MSGQGKSLQDIYDAGTKRLEELEQKQKGELEVAGSKSVEELGHIESSVMQRMEKSLLELDQEVRSYLDKAMEGIKGAAASELEENTKFLERLNEGFKLSCQGLSEDVQELKVSLAARINSKTENNLLLQKRQHEQATSILKTEGASAASQLKEKSQLSVSAFDAENSGIIMKVLDKNINLPTEFFAEFTKSIENIDKRMTECMQLLSARGKEICKELANDTTEIQASLDTTLQHIQATMDESYQQSDVTLEAQCEQTLAESLQYQEMMAANLAREIQGLPSSSGTGVAEKLNNLRSDTDKLLEQVKQLLVDVDFGIRTQASDLTENFEQSLQQRMENAREHHKVVGEERDRLMERIAVDLREIESGFQVRLTDLAQQCLGRLSTVCVDAELAIVSAHDACAAEFKNVSSAHQKAIEDKTQAILIEIETLSSRATEAIKAAAGDGAAGAAAQVQAGSVAELELPAEYGDNPFGDLRL